ncbi:MAG TPA: glycosyltransferase [Candidatus Paceibacterota bacterium]|jgi:cellulose synthase (UDP-forming)|nr:glycosyltransferase [Candidatus Paceibacterota bacterium]
MHDEQFLKNTQVPKLLLAVNILLALFYFFMIAFFFQKGELVLFWLLIFGEVFHLWQAITFIWTIWDTEHDVPKDPQFTPPVDVFITVAGEPIDVIEATVRGALAMDYPNFYVFILNDGYVAKKENWADVVRLADQLGVNCITRRKPRGAKAGNINNGLSVTESPFVAFFDSDHIPKPEFLRETVPYFADSQLAFVQTPQFYKNSETNFVAGGAWEQQSLFFGPICKGKNRLNAVTMCGTNMVVRRTALMEVGGMYEGSIAEDFITGFFLHKNGWKSLYVPKVLARGLAPEDFLAYTKQQARWARGSLDLIFQHNLLFTRGITFKQRMQYLSSVSYFLSGWVVLIDAIIPLMFFFTGQFPIQTSTMALATVFIPYILLMLYTIQRSSNSSFTYRALAFSVAGFQIHIASSVASFFRRKSGFSITPKRAQRGNFLYLTVAQMAYIPLVVAGAAYSVVHAHGVVTPAWVANFSWGLINAVVFAKYVRAAAPQTQEPMTVSALLQATQNQEVEI